MTDNQFEQLFGTLTKLVSSVQALEKGQEELKQEVVELKQGQTTLQTEFHEFREETRENFDKLSRE